MIAKQQIDALQLKCEQYRQSYNELLHKSSNKENLGTENYKLDLQVNWQILVELLVQF